MQPDSWQPSQLSSAVHGTFPSMQMGVLPLLRATPPLLKYTSLKYTLPMYTLYSPFA